MEFVDFSSYLFVSSLNKPPSPTSAGISLLVWNKTFSWNPRPDLQILLFTAPKFREVFTCFIYFIFCWSCILLWFLINYQI